MNYTNICFVLVYSNIVYLMLEGCSLAIGGKLPVIFALADVL